MDLKSTISKREKTFFIITVSVVILSLVFSFVIEPLYKKHIQVEQEIRVKELRLIKNLKLMREKDIITKGFEKYSDRLKTKSSNEEEMASVLSEIEKIGKKAGIYLSNVKPQRIKDMNFYKILLVEIKFQANMQTLSKFIYNLQNSTSLLKVKRLQINIKGGGSSLLDGVLRISKISLS